MNEDFESWIDIVAKTLTGVGIVIAALNYWNQTKIKRAEWLKSLFEKFYENDKYKDVRKWLDSGELEKKVNINDTAISKEEMSNLQIT